MVFTSPNSLRKVRRALQSGTTAFGPSRNCSGLRMPASTSMCSTNLASVCAVIEGVVCFTVLSDVHYCAINPRGDVDDRTKGKGTEHVAIIDSSASMVVINWSLYARD